MSPYPTTLPTRRERRQRRQEMIAETRAPKPTPTETRLNNLGPLTTTWVPPPHCTKPALACATCSSARQAQLCKTQLNGKKSEDDTECWPQATAFPTRAPQAPLGGVGFYSPGIICPTGYATACMASSLAEPAQTTGPGRGGSFQFPLEAGETGIGCCPKGYACARIAGQQTCTQVATSTKLDLMTCAGTNTQNVNAFAIPFVKESKTVTAFTLYAPMFQLVHQSSDLEPKVTDIASMAPSTKTPSRHTTTATPSSAPVRGQTFSTSNALSRTEIAGIVVGSIILILCFLSIFAYIFMRKRRQIPSTSSAEKSKGLSDSPSTTTESSPSTTPKVHSLNAFSIPISASSPHDPHHKHYSAYQLGFPNSPVPLTSMSPDGHIDIDTEVARFGRTLGVEDDLESPIDGTSPFRLKRGNTIKMKRDKSLSRKRVCEHSRSRSVSPLAKGEGGPEEWDEVIDGAGLDRNVSAVTEPGSRKVGKVMERVPEVLDSTVDMGTWKSRRASVLTVKPGSGAGVAL